MGNRRIGFDSFPIFIRTPLSRDQLKEGRVCDEFMQLVLVANATESTVCPFETLELNRAHIEAFDLHSAYNGFGEYETSTHKADATIKAAYHRLVTKAHPRIPV